MPKVAADKKFSYINTPSYALVKNKNNNKKIKRVVK